MSVATYDLHIVTIMLVQTCTECIPAMLLVTLRGKNDKNESTNGTLLSILSITRKGQLEGSSLCTKKMQNFCAINQKGQIEMNPFKYYPKWWGSPVLYPSLHLHQRQDGFEHLAG